MKTNNIKKLAAAVVLTSLSSLSVADPLATVLGLVGGLGGGGIPSLGALPVDPTALLGSGANLVSIGNLPVSPADLLGLVQLIPLQTASDLVANTGLPLNSMIQLTSGITDFNALPINPLAVITGGGLTGVPAYPALLLGGGLPGLTLIPVAPLAPIINGGLPDIGALPSDVLALIPL